MKTYSIKVTLRGVSPMIWRRIRICGSTSLISLQALIRVAQDYDKDQLHQFRIYAKDYEIYRNQCVDRSDNFCHAVIDDFHFDVGDRFIYISYTEIEFSFMKNRLYDIRIESIEEKSPRKKHPFCISGNGMLGVSKKFGVRNSGSKFRVRSCSVPFTVKLI